MADNPIAVPAGRSRVPRFREQAEQDADPSPSSPAPAPAADPTTGISFSKGQQPTAAEAAKKKQGLIDAMRWRGDIASADSDADDTSDA